jgi:hypothetical protein
MKDIHKLRFRVKEPWQVVQDAFYNIEPDNTLPLGKVAGYFSEHLFQGLYGDFVIDAGFFGTYHLDRTGHFGIYLLKGNFYEGELLEKRIFRSSAKASAFVQGLITLVTEGKYEKTKGLKFGNDSFLVGLKQYSSKGEVGFARW